MKAPIALQLYSIREECAADLSDTLSAVAKMGYEGVEFVGYQLPENTGNGTVFGHSSGDAKNMCNDLGLHVAGFHMAPKFFEEEHLDKTLAFNLELENSNLIYPIPPGTVWQGDAPWEPFAADLKRISSKAEPMGIQIGFHNHNVEFTGDPGKQPWDILATQAGSSLNLQLDTGNAIKGGADPIELLKRYPGRSKTVHLKEIDASGNWVVMGKGITPWKEIVSLCEETQGTEWFIIEQEMKDVSAMDCVEKCLKGLKDALA